MRNRNRRAVMCCAIAVAYLVSCVSETETIQPNGLAVGEEIPYARRLLQEWQPTIDDSGHVESMQEGGAVRLKNDWMEVAISGRTGEITAMLLKGQDVLEKPAGVIIRDALGGKTYGQTQGRVSDFLVSSDAPQHAEATYRKTYDRSFQAIIRFTIDRQALCWDVVLYTELPDREVNIDFVFPLLSRFEKIFWASENAPFELSKIPATRIAYRQWDVCQLPAATLYNSTKDYGVSFVGPFDLPKPGPSFGFARQFTYSNPYLLAGKNKPARAAVYVVAHEGDWRPGLAWMLRTYPRHFYPSSQRVVEGEGWSCVSWPWEQQESSMRWLGEQGVTWDLLHGHYPFYGLYVPDDEEWDLLLGAADSGRADFSMWEKGIPQGEMFSKTLARRIIDAWHHNDIQMYLYFQSCEAWNPYADKSFSGDIARDRSGNPYGAWFSCRLMNPDPQSPWGKHIAGQIQKLTETYPEADGICLDRNDYCNYDFSHRDGVTMMGDRACSMLAFAQEQINSLIADTLHPLGMGIWANGPTGIEVCRDMDGVTSDVSLRSLQYVGLIRPMMFHPLDTTLEETEVKLKSSLYTGCFPNVTEDGGTENFRFEEKFKRIFSLLKGRKLVLSPHALELPAGERGNIFQSPSGEYLVVLVNWKRSQLSASAASHDVPVRIRVPDAIELNHCYLLSGDYRGVNQLDFTQDRESVEVQVPFHLTSSMLVFSKETMFNVTRDSPPVLVRGERNRLLFAIRNPSSTQANDDILVSLPWLEKREMIAVKPEETKAYSVDVDVPLDAKLGETEFSIVVNGEKERMSAWVVDAVQVDASGPIFIKQPSGEDVPLRVVNNTGRRTRIDLSASVEDGEEQAPVASQIVLAPYEDRTVLVRIVTKSEGGTLRTAARYSGGAVVASSPFTCAMSASQSDLFLDDFISGSMRKWQVKEGTFDVTGGSAKGKAERYFAMTGDSSWSDYAFQVTSKIEGSEDPAVGWLKSYIFFRVKDERNYYRFGIHGDARWIDLAKSVNGTEFLLGQVAFEPEMNRWYILKVEVHGRNITGYVDGEPVISVQDGTFLSGGVGIGVREDSMSTCYKDGIVRSR